MARMKKNKKIKQMDVNRNAGINISHTINKIKANERKYTIILVSFFMILFCFIGYFTLRVNSTDALGNFSNETTQEYFSSFSQVITLADDDIMSDVEGLKSKLYKISMINNEDNPINYKVVFMKNTSIMELCHCNDKTIEQRFIKFSIDGKNYLSFSNEDEMVIQTGVLEESESDTLEVRVWLDDYLTNIINDNHYHGKFVFEKVE